MTRLVAGAIPGSVDSGGARVQLQPGPMEVARAAFSTKAEVLDDLKSLGFWPTTYVSERMQELPLHWHDFDDVGYVLEGHTYILNEQGERIELGPGDKLILPRGAVHAEGEVTQKTVWIVGIPMAANLLDVFAELRDPASSPTFAPLERARSSPTVAGYSTSS